MFNRFCLSTGLAILGLMATSLTAIGATTNGNQFDGYRGND
ncbi:hypothetical protein [Lactiplantibacillus plantarum]|nr:hypothetical protein [Lactiplantibacillus plantarum]